MLVKGSLVLSGLVIIPHICAQNTGSLSTLHFLPAYLAAREASFWFLQLEGWCSHQKIYSSSAFSAPSLTGILPQSKNVPNTHTAMSEHAHTYAHT